MKEKFLFIFIDDNVFESDESYYYMPKMIENISYYADYVRGIPTSYDHIVVKEGMFEHTFELYRDSRVKNLYYLVQRHEFIIPLRTKLKFIVKKYKEGRLRKTDSILEELIDYEDFLKEVFKEIASEVVSQIVGEFDYYIFFRFSFYDEEQTSGIVMFTPDAYNVIVDSFPHFAVNKETFTLHYEDVNLSNVLTTYPYPSLLMFLRLPYRKVYYDVSISYNDLLSVVEGEVVQRVRENEYLDEVMEGVIKTYFVVED